MHNYTAKKIPHFTALVNNSAKVNCTFLLPTQITWLTTGEFPAYYRRTDWVQSKSHLCCRSLCSPFRESMVTFPIKVYFGDHGKRLSH